MEQQHATPGQPLILWSVDRRDWDGRTSSRIRSHVVANTTSGDIVLMHDRVAATIDAVPGIVSDLRARGFTLVTVETLVPGMEPGDVVHSRGQVQQPTTAAPTTESAPQLVEEAPFVPGR
jgi:hypothetical protein